MLAAQIAGGICTHRKWTTGFVQRRGTAAYRGNAGWREALAALERPRRYAPALTHRADDDGRGSGMCCGPDWLLACRWKPYRFGDDPQPLVFCNLPCDTTPYRRFWCGSSIAAAVLVNHNSNLRTNVSFDRRLSSASPSVPVRLKAGSAGFGAQNPAAASIPLGDSRSAGMAGIRRCASKDAAPGGDAAKHLSRTPPSCSPPAGGSGGRRTINRDPVRVSMVIRHYPCPGVGLGRLRRAAALDGGGRPQCWLAHPAVPARGAAWVPLPRREGVTTALWITDLETAPTLRRPGLARWRDALAVTKSAAVSQPGSWRTGADQRWSGPWPWALTVWRPYRFGAGRDSADQRLATTVIGAHPGGAVGMT